MTPRNPSVLEAWVGGLAIVYVAVVGFIWFDALSSGWGGGWALVGTLNVTAAALLVLGRVWLHARLGRRFRT